MGPWESRTSADPLSFLRSCGADLQPPQSRHHRNLRSPQSQQHAPRPEHQLIWLWKEAGKGRAGQGSNKIQNWAPWDDVVINVIHTGYGNLTMHLFALFRRSMGVEGKNAWKEKRMNS